MVGWGALGVGFQTWGWLVMIFDRVGLGAGGGGWGQNGGHWGCDSRYGDGVPDKGWGS